MIISPRTVATMKAGFLTGSFVVGIAILIFSVVSSTAALDESADAIVNQVVGRVSEEVFLFLQPVEGFTQTLHESVGLGLWQDTDNVFEFARLVAPGFAASRSLLALYSARSSDRYTQKFSAEKQDVFIVHERVYVNSTYQERRECQFDRDGTLSSCVLPSEWTAKDYDPFARGWYKLGSDYSVANEGKRFSLMGPELQTSNAVGNTDEPVFSMVTSIPSVDMVIRCKFRTSELSSFLNGIEVGNSGAVFVVNAVTGEIVALGGNVVGIDSILRNDGGDSPFYTLFDFPGSTFTSLSTDDLVPLSSSLTVDDGALARVAQMETLAGLEEFRIIVAIDPNDALPTFNDRITLTLIFASVSVTFVVLRIIAEVLARIVAKGDPSEAAQYEIRGLTLTRSVPNSPAAKQMNRSGSANKLVVMRKSSLATSQTSDPSSDAAMEEGRFNFELPPAANSREMAPLNVPGSLDVSPKPVRQSIREEEEA